MGELQGFLYKHQSKNNLIKVGWSLAHQVMMKFMSHIIFQNFTSIGGNLVI